MGYDTNGETRHRPKRMRSWLFIILGIIVGAVAMYLFYVNTGSENGIAQKDSSQHLLPQKVMDGQVQVDVSTQITDIVDSVSPAVVGVTNIQTRSDFWMEEETESDEAGTGSGVIYKKDKENAYVVTNQHVVEGADTLEVVLDDETNLEAELLGSDLFTDLAVLQVDANAVGIPIDIGSSAGLKVGEPVIAIGNPLGHMFAGSVTQGIISGKQRTIPQDFNQDGQPDWQAEVIQTDAAINPGNSGGALINMSGQLIGINSMKISQAIAQGIGFAIPIDTAMPVIEELEATGAVTRPFLGVEIYSLEEVPQAEWRNTLNLPKNVDGGVYVWSIESASPAVEAGLERLDVITEFDGKKIHDILDLRHILYEDKEIGDKVSVVYYRNGEKHETSLTLTEQK